MRHSGYSILLLFCLAACIQPPQPGRQPVKLVRSILSDRASAEYSLLSSFSLDRSGTVCIIGSKEECAEIADAFLRSDRRDNVTGNAIPDGLHDFAGETFISLYDTTASAICPLFTNVAQEDAIRERCVRNTLSAIDTVLGFNPAKLIILASSLHSEYGLFDVDSLFSATGCKALVVNPLTVMKSLSGAASGATVGVIASPEKLPSGIYSGCIAFPSEDIPDELGAFLDKYIDAGYSASLDALIIDDSEVDIAAIDSTLTSIISGNHDRSTEFSSVLSSGFRILEPRSVTAEECFRLLRKENLFTHKIAYPVLKTICSD